MTTPNPLSPEELARCREAAVKWFEEENERTYAPPFKCGDILQVNAFQAGAAWSAAQAKVVDDLVRRLEALRTLDPYEKPYPLAPGYNEAISRCIAEVLRHAPREQQLGITKGIKQVSTLPDAPEQHSEGGGE